MEHSFAEPLSDAFSETAVTSFSDGDLDFENIHFEDKYIRTEVVEKQYDDISDNEDFEGAGVRSSVKILEEDYTSSESEQEGSVSGQYEVAEAEDMGTGAQPESFFRSVSCSDEFCVGNKEDRVFAEGQPLVLEGAENPQVRKEVQGEGDEEVSYFERVPERSNEMMLRGDGIREEDEQEKEEDLCDSECEGMKIEQEENVQCFGQEFENTCGDEAAKASLEFPEISGQNLKDLIAEVNGDENGEKMKEFSGEEHQDAGESFADYPSDFSSCEYVGDEGKRQESNALACASNSETTEKQNTGLEKYVTDLISDVTCMGKDEDTEEEGGMYQYSRDSEVYECRRLDVATGEKEVEENVWVDAAVAEVDNGGETGENDSYTSSDDYVQEKRSDEELFVITPLQEPETTRNWRTLKMGTVQRLMTKDIDEVKTPLSDVTQRPAAEDVHSYSVVQRGDTKQTTSPSNSGSLDDDFFFNTEAYEITELGQLGEDESEEERNWDEQERIRAFYEYYDDSDEETRRRERQIKVQFCSDPLSQVIHYETDECSDRDSHRSCTEGEEDLSSAETSEELREIDVSREMTPACDTLNTQPPENMPDISDTHICSRKQKCFNVLKLTLKMCVVILTGLLMFWLASDQAFI
ncbi:Dual specificity protein phosphatase 19 [Dissostichus eleginoides]|uniref:Dual specificity protein phosphatase 19 n=1 Tax=Dissostichus eleginoides TaxID=100907 RepID=A0AAD9CBD4_DISEL|nr:Dual specificity protein phosphatase 19 [Dissostichus eleginoides]